MGNRRAAIWTIAVTILGAVCQLVQLSIAARYLDAHAFGALAIVNVAIAVISGFQDMGLSSYCVHLGNVPRRSHSTLFWISTLLGMVGGLVILLLSTPVAVFYKNDLLAPLLQLLALNFLLIGLSGQYQANYIRVFRSQLLAKIELSARLIGFAVTVWLLVKAGAGPEAVVIGMEVFALCKLLLMICFAEKDWHPGFEFDRELAPRALKYGGYQAGSQIVNQLRMQVDQLIIGRALGPESLGLYSICKELISYPLRVMQPLISRFTLPMLASHQNDPVKLRAAFIRGLTTTAIFCCGIYGLLALLAPWVVEILYGPAFMAVALMLPLMTMFGALRPLGLNTGMLAQATGRTSNEFTWNVGISFITVLPNLLIAFWAPSLPIFAGALSAIQVCVTLLAYPFFIKALEPIGMGAYLRSWAAPAVGAILASALALSGWIHMPPIKDLLHRFF